MESHRATMCLGLLGLLLAPAFAHAAGSSSDARPLRLGLATQSHAQDMAAIRPDRADRPTGRRAANAPLPRDSVGQRALQGMFEATEVDSLAGPEANASPFRFRRQGNAGRDLREGYKDMCEKVSRKVWDDPNGKRVKFDVAGKPGLAFEIPIR